MLHSSQVKHLLRPKVRYLACSTEAATSTTIEQIVIVMSTQGQPKRAAPGLGRQTRLQIPNVIHRTTRGTIQFHVYQYSKVRYGTTPDGRFLRSDSHRAIQAEIFPRLAALSTFTVATIRAQSSESAKHVSSKNELCSEYGTPKNCVFGVEPRAGRRCVYVNSRCGGCARMDAIDGVVLVPAGGE